VDAGLAASKGQARTFLNSGAISINGQKAGPDNLDLFVKGNNLLKRGKNSFAIIEKK
jgi:tyrosyl-tRNA synthetase